MRAVLLSFASAVLLCSPAQAQRRAAWTLSVGGTLAGFGAAASDTTAAGGGATIRPDQAIALDLGVGRRIGAWDVALGMGYLPSHVQVTTTDIDVVGRSISLDRLRLSLGLSRRVARFGTASLHVGAAPTLDLWSMTDADAHTTVGATGRLALRLRAGAVEIENGLDVGWSAAPFAAGDLPDGFRTRGLRSIAFGTSLRFDL